MILSVHDAIVSEFLGNSWYVYSATVYKSTKIGSRNVVQIKDVMMYS
jgi:hypothetical protein